MIDLFAVILELNFAEIVRAYWVQLHSDWCYFHTDVKKIKKIFKKGDNFLSSVKKCSYTENVKIFFLPKRRIYFNCWDIYPLVCVTLSLSWKIDLEV